MKEKRYATVQRAKGQFINVGPTFGPSQTVSLGGFLEQIPLDMAPNSIAKTSILIHTYGTFCLVSCQPDGASV